MKIKVRKTKNSDVNKALKLIVDNYEGIIKEIGYLPPVESYLDNLKAKVKSLFKEGLGVSALYKGEYLGFLIGYKVKELFGSDKGIYIPLYGHGIVKNDKKRIYEKLYENAAEIWVKDNFFNHAITVPTFDKEVIQTFFWLGFGLRCIDAIKKIEMSDYNQEKSNISIKKASLQDLHLMSVLAKKDNLYYSRSPIFMPSDGINYLEDLKEWLKKEDHHLWIALSEDKAVGYIRIEPEGETIISKHPQIMNITGAFVDENYRRKKIGLDLLNTVLNWLYRRDYKLCGVDFESINIIGRHFWIKHFTPYTYSLHRHIDDRAN